MFGRNSFSVLEDEENSQEEENEVQEDCFTSSHVEDQVISGVERKNTEGNTKGLSEHREE